MVSAAAADSQLPAAPTHPPRLLPMQQIFVTPLLGEFTWAIMQRHVFHEILGPSSQSFTMWVCGVLSRTYNVDCMAIRNNAYITWNLFTLQSGNILKLLIGDDVVTERVFQTFISPLSIHWVIFMFCLLGMPFLKLNTYELGSLP